MTLTQLKRDANSGKLTLELIERFGKTGENIPNTLRGMRKVTGSNSVGIFLQNENGQTSELTIKSAKLVEYTNDMLLIYEAGEREPTEEERRVLNEWDKLEKEYYKNNPYGDTFWKKKLYFQNSICPWMSGFSDTIRGKRYQMHNQKVLDNKLRGNIILKYKVYRA